jgi:predicted N-acetyltransferase YhbS
MMGVKIRFLKEYSQWIPIIAEWFYEEWGEFHPELDVDEIAERLWERCNTDRIPLALVAVQQDEDVIGTVSLKEYDMDTRKHFSPWLASLYVKRDCRNKGVGVRLIDAGLEKAMTLGVRQLYLYTRIRKHVDFYLSHGWTQVETTDYRGGWVAILLKTLD